MQKTILITGSTDGIGLQTAKSLIKEGHKVLIHGRDKSKLENTKLLLGTQVDSFLADLSNIDEVKKFAKEVKSKYSKIDVLINNAGVYKSKETLAKNGLDIRVVVNTIAPYLLTKELFELFDLNSRVINLSSAAQAPVSMEAINGDISLSDSEAYAMSKLAIAMWTNYFAKKYKEKVGVFVSINPASFLGSKMVKEAYGISGNDINIGVDILCRATLSEEFSQANGKYYDNDIKKFANPHPQALDFSECELLVDTMEEIIKNEI